MSEAVVMNGNSASLLAFQQAFTGYVRDPQHRTPPPSIPLERMQLYAQLVFGNVERVMGNMFPVLKSRLPECQWLALAREFFRDHDLHDPLFQSMPREFLNFLEQRAPAADDPPYLLELAHWEWVDYALSIDTTEIELDGIERDGCIMDGLPVLNPLLWMLSYQHPVQRYRDEAPLAPAAESPTYLVAWRDLDDRVGYLELNAVTARLLELLDGGAHACGGLVLEALAAELGQPCDDDFVRAGSEILEDLRKRHVVLGTRERSL